MILWGSGVGGRDEGQVLFTEIGYMFFFNSKIWQRFLKTGNFLLEWFQELYVFFPSTLRDVKVYIKST